jgi:hypothetical protein
MVLSTASSSSSGNAKPERQVHDRRTWWYRQTGVEDYDEIGVPQLAYSTREVCVYDATPLHSASTISGVGRAPWAPSFVTAAAPARTA